MAGWLAMVKIIIIVVMDHISVEKHGHLVTVVELVHLQGHRIFNGNAVHLDQGGQEEHRDEGEGSNCKK